MKRTYRLRRPDQFQRVRREGRTLSSSLLLLNHAPSRRRQTRCGIVVSRHIGGAVQRNRAKRRVREAIRLVFAAIPRGYDLVFIIRSPSVAEVPFTLLQSTVTDLLRRAGLWQERLSVDNQQGQ